MMPVSDKNSVYTIGHSTHSLAEFIGMLESFQVKVLVDIRALPGSRKYPTAMMCAEAVWWRCHRSMVSDYLKVKGWNVLHIMASRNAKEHTYTSPARIVDGDISYVDEDRSSE